MEHLVDVLRARRSVRRFELEPIPQASLEVLREAVLRAPSSRGLDSRRFVFVSDPAMLEELSRSRDHGSAFIAGAALGIVVCGYPDVTDCWVEDCSIAATAAQLAATDLGLGSCWIQIRNRTASDGTSSGDWLRKVLGIETTLEVECLIAVGVPAAVPEPRPSQALRWESISER